MLPSPRLPSQPETFDRGLSPWAAEGGFRGENRPAAGGLRFNFHWGTAGGREGKRHRRLKGRSRPGQREPEKRPARGGSEQPPPFRQAPSAPLPHRSAPRDPHQTRDPPRRPRGGRVPAPSSCPGTREQHVPTRLPRPCLPVAAALPLSGAGNFHSPSQVDPNSLPTSPPPHAAGDVPLS